MDGGVRGWWKEKKLFASFPLLPINYQTKISLIWRFGIERVFERKNPGDRKLKSYLFFEFLRLSID